MLLFYLYAVLLLADVSSAASRSNPNPSQLIEVDIEALAGTSVSCGTCGNYPCGAGYVNKPSTTTCGRDKCNLCSCCIQKKTCQDWAAAKNTCSAGKQLVKDAATKYCSAVTCTEPECCQALPTCAGYNCGNLLPISPTPVCTSGSCSATTCCKCRPSCDSFACGSLTRKSSPSLCAASGCTTSDCCTASFCSSYTCSQGTLKSNAGTLQCSGSCSDATCCEVKTCISFSCGANGIQKSGASSLACPSNVCSFDFCCDATCPSFQCSTGYRANPASSSLTLCPPQTTTTTTSVAPAPWLVSTTETGCTPGFWKNHLDIWSMYQNLDFDTVFGINYYNPDMTLYKAIFDNGNPFPFHLVSAWLNSLWLPGRFRYTTEQVMTLARSRTSANELTIKDLLASANEAGGADHCPLGGPGPKPQPPAPSPAPPPCDNLSRCCIQNTCANAPATNGQYNCPSGWTIVPNWQTKACAGSCTDSECCSPPAKKGNCATFFDCSASNKIINPARATGYVCAAELCTSDECCLPTCATGPHNCPSSRPIILNPIKMKCASFPCQDDECCQRTCATQDGVGIRCSPSQNAVSDFETKVCPKVSFADVYGTCTQATCCIETCRNVVCALGTSPKTPPAGSSVITCASTCSNSDCCEVNRCPEGYVCGNGYRQKTDMSTVACDLKSCRVDECCVPLACKDALAFSGCAGGTVPKVDFAQRGCSGAQCENSDCCNPVCPGGVSCTGSMKPVTGQVVCTSGSCSQSDCCIPKTCSDYACPVTYAPKSGVETTPCNPASSCISLCCLPPAQCFAPGSGVTSCPAGTRPRTGAEPMTCGQQCNQADCCINTCASWTCTGGRIRKDNAAMIDCLRPTEQSPGVCSEDFCCVETCLSLDNVSPICSVNQVRRPDFDTHVCDGGFCRAPDCCQNTCAGYNCGDYFTLIMNPRGTLCDSATQNCQAVCCTENYCPTNPDFCPVGYVLKPMGPRCLTLPCQKHECCDEQLCFPSFACPREQGWIPKSTNPSCGGTACTKETCCVRKTCEGYAGCLSGALDLAHNLGGINCATSECTDAECCIPVCDLSDTGFCGAGKRFKRTDTIIECVNTPCHVDECCEDRTCAGPPAYSCVGFRMELKTNPSSHICSATCDDFTCCTQIRDHCFDATGGVPSCPSNWRPLPADHMPNPCPGSLCETTDCCALTCASFNCGDRPRKNTNEACANNVCSMDFCCQPPCTTSVCTPTDALIPNMYCEGDCTRERCCIPTCASITCEVGYERRVMAATQCGSTCSHDVCCKPVVCGSHSCPAKMSPKPAMPDIHCTSGTCTDSDCCNPNTCANHVCPEGQQNLDGTVRCDLAECRDDECCTPITCEGYVCPEPYSRYMPLNGCRHNPCVPSECCRPTCTASICPSESGYSPREDRMDTFCAGMTCTPAECCEPLTCGNSGFQCPTKPGQVLTRLPLTNLCPSGCRESNCCLYKAPECFVAGSGLLECPAGTLRKSMTVPCTGQCSTFDCCDRTCTYQDFVGCGPRPMKPNPADIVCTDGVCSVDTCCDNYCTTGDFRCTGQLQFRMDASTTICPASGCTDHLCCEPKSCESYTCPATSHKIAGAMCGVDGCSDEICCIKTCASVTCPATYSPKNPDSECGSGCTTSNCCTKTCSGYSCCYPYVLKPNPETLTCTGECGNAYCCMPTCEAFDCSPFGLQKKPAADTIVCTTQSLSIGSSLGGTGYSCTKTKCCDAGCSASSCPPGKRLKDGMLGKSCGDSTCEGYCCEDKTCANQAITCPAKWQQVSDYATKACGTSCSYEACCTPIDYFCTIAACNAGFTLKSDVTAPCPAQTCTNDYCCLPTCATVSCSTLGRPTMAGTSQCAATGCNPDDCCGRYCSENVCTTPGYTMISNMIQCATLTCTEGECCHPTCATWTCSSPDKALISNPRGTPCAGGVCNDEQCCYTKTCPSGVCGNGYHSKGLMSCTVCDQNDCCEQNTCTNMGVVCETGYQRIQPDRACTGCGRSECCEPICTGSICGAGYHSIVTPCEGSDTCRGTKCLSDPCAMNDGACCEANTCKGFVCPALYTPRPATTTCRNNPCLRDECCSQMDVNCFDANSQVKTCDNGRVPKLNAGAIKCANQECTQAICCDETCASSQSGLCGSRPRDMSAQSHVCNDQQGCVADECCLNTCASSPVPCGPVAVARTPASDITCAALQCTANECCQDICRSITCDNGYYMSTPAKPCFGNPCTKSECCVPTTCATTSSLTAFVCPTGYRPKAMPASEILCGGECTVSTCCEPVRCPASYTCDTGSTPKTDMANQLCPEGQCRNQDCCQLACSGWFAANACPVGSRSRLMSSTPEISCPNGQCSASLCCIENTCDNTAFVCAAPNWLKRSDYSTKKCTSTSTCTESDCCVPTCATYSCTNGYSPKPTPSGISCTTGCNDNVCCTRTTCPSGYACRNTNLILRDNYMTLTCATSTCQDTDCCRDQCVNIQCPAGYQKNSVVGCAGMQCTVNECCVAKPTCPSNFVCPSGTFLKKAGTTCEKLPCTTTECCCSTCTYCSSWTGKCSLGQALVPGASCPSGTCSASICCTPSCKDYPCVGQLLLPDASCPGLSACDAGWCCQDYD